MGPEIKGGGETNLPIRSYSWVFSLETLIWRLIVGYFFCNKRFYWKEKEEWDKAEVQNSIGKTEGQTDVMMLGISIKISSQDDYYWVLLIRNIWLHCEEKEEGDKITLGQNVYLIEMLG